MDALGGEAAHLQQAGEPVGHVLGIAEHDGAVIALGDENALHGVQLFLPAGQLDAVLLDVGLVLLVGADGDLHRVALVHPGDVHDLPGDGGGEHAQVFAVGHFVQNVGHIPDEAHIQHPVGLVQHHSLHLVQTDGVPLHMVHEAARGGHHDLGLLLQSGDLLVDGRAAVQAHGAHALLEPAEIAQFILDLNGQLPGGGQHQAQNIGGLRIDVLHHGDTEGIGLARARRGLGNDILPVHEERDGAPLHGSGLGIALPGQRLHGGLGQAQLVIHDGFVDDLAVDFHTIVPFV